METRLHSAARRLEFIISSNCDVEDLSHQRQDYRVWALEEL
jgi:hypothetical protein